MLSGPRRAVNQLDGPPVRNKNFGARQVHSGRTNSSVLASPAVPSAAADWTARTLFQAGSYWSPRPVRQAGVWPCPPRSFHVEGVSDLRDPARNAGRDYGRWAAL